jgi:hypothetical protein
MAHTLSVLGIPVVRTLIEHSVVIKEFDHTWQTFTTFQLLAEGLTKVLPNVAGPLQAAQFKCPCSLLLICICPDRDIGHDVWFRPSREVGFFSIGPSPILQ